MTLLETFTLRLQEALLAHGIPARVVDCGEDAEFIRVSVAFPADLPLTCLCETSIKVRMVLPKAAMREGMWFALGMAFSVEKAHVL